MPLTHTRAGRRPAGWGWLLLALAETLGFAWSWQHKSPFLMLWFGLGVTFLVAGLASCLRCPPNDLLLLVQFCWHTLLALPLAAGGVDHAMARTLACGIAGLLFGLAALLVLLLAVFGLGGRSSTRLWMICW